MHTYAVAYAIARGVTLPFIPCFFALFSHFGGPAQVDLHLCVRLSGSSMSSSAEDGNVNICSKVWKTTGQ